MRPTPLHHLRSVWPFWVSGLLFLIGLAVDGLGGGLIAATLSFLVVGPLYLARQWWLGRTGRIPPPAPPTPRQQAIFLRLIVIVNAVVGIGFLVAAVDGGWLPGRDWTAALVVVAACSLGAAPYIWATAAEVEHGRASQRAWAVAAASDLLVAVGLLGFAAVNLWTVWLPWGWSVALALVGAMWVVMALGCVARFRTPGSARPTRPG
ncbi:MAG TPA: hypothetical protein VD769_11095 [Gaiellaceae bacterium]|nr:hypothetical protein [Gaiellaceae bacterium]